MNSLVRRLDLSQEYFFDEGCHIIEISNSDDDAEVSIAQARVEKGQQTKWHRLENTTERYVILQGTGSVEVGDSDPCPISAGDVVIIPQATRQRIRNTGSEDLRFLAICSPRFQKSNYRQGTGIDTL